MEEILATVFADLQKGATQTKHPYRYFCLSSIKNNIPQQRMVVFRAISGNTISIFTDIRTSKVSDFKENPNASVLFYDSNEMKQIQLTGVVDIQEEYDASVWDSISPKAKKDYTTLDAPGMRISSPEKVIYNEENINFCILKLTFTKIDYLNISRPYHIRTQFTLIDNKWQGAYVVP